MPPAPTRPAACGPAIPWRVDVEQDAAAELTTFARGESDPSETATLPHLSQGELDKFLHNNAGHEKGALKAAFCSRPHISYSEGAWKTIEKWVGPEFMHSYLAAVIADEPPAAVAVAMPVETRGSTVRPAGIIAGSVCVLGAGAMLTMIGQAIHNRPWSRANSSDNTFAASYMSGVGVLAAGFAAGGAAILVDDLAPQSKAPNVLVESGLLGIGAGLAIMGFGDLAVARGPEESAGLYRDRINAGIIFAPLGSAITIGTAYLFHFSSLSPYVGQNVAGVQGNF